MSNPTELPDLDNVKTWPARIWLQHGCDEMPNYAETRGVEDGITWCEDNTATEDVEYVRADLARRAKPEGEAPQAEPVKNLKRYSIDSKGIPFLDEDGVWVAYEDLAGE